MIARISSSLVDDIGGSSSKLRPLALEAKVRDASHVFVAVAKVVGEEEHQLLHFAKQRALHGNLLEITCLRELECLDGVRLFSGCKVEVVAVDEEMKGFGG
jgi:hypothetical protein